MIGLNIELAVILIATLFLFFFSLVENAIANSSPLTLRMILERPEQPNLSMLSLILEDRPQFLFPLHLALQVLHVTVAVVTTHACLYAWPSHGLVDAFFAVLAISAVFHLLLPRLLTQHESGKKLLLLLRLYRPFHGVLRAVASPLFSILSMFRRLHEEIRNDDKPQDEEVSEDEIQAYLEIGEDEGILQEEDTKLIQSVVEFGNTLVREVMTPRTKIIACEENATMGDLRDLMVRHRHSRIPIYRENMDHIVGIAYIRQLMAVYSKERENDPITSLINPALFVPDTKPVSKLLKELQERGDHVAIVIDEYGGVAGLVTIEDLVEEIVGEIRDEDEAKVSKIIEEGERTFVMRGVTELPRLEDLAGMRFENRNCATVAGLIMAYLGRVPARGETFEMEGIKVQVLDADRRRIHWVRMYLPDKSGSDPAKADPKQGVEL